MLVPAAQLAARLRQVLLVAALVIGSVMGLVLAHTEDTHHAVEATPASASAYADEATASAAWWLGEAMVAGDAADPAPLGDALALCLSLAACFVVLMLALFGLRRMPAQWRLLAQSVADPPMAAARRALPVLQRPLLCIYRI